MADVETPFEGSEAVGTRERDGRRTSPKAIPHPTAGERAARGKEARAAAARTGHGEWEPASDRPDPVELLEEQAATRVPELVPIRYGRMLVSPFTFFRGAAYLMATDLAGAPRTGLHVQLCGDAHLSNFGAFAAPDRRLVFSLNDFDETLPGPFEWDVKRLVASFAVAGRDRDFDAKQRQAITRAVTRSYREAIRAFGEMSNLEVWYARIDVDEIAALAAQHATGKQRKRFERNLAKARSKDSLKAFAKLTTVVDGERRIASDPPLIVPIEEVVSGVEQVELEEFVRGVIRSYRRTLAPTAGSCSSVFATSIRRGRSSAWAASARVRGSCSCWGATRTIRCSFSSRRRSHRCSSRFWARARSTITGSGSSRASD